MLYRVSTLLVFFIFKTFFSLEVKGKDCIPDKKNFILASNHLSNLDPPILASVCPRRVNFAAKKELFIKPFDLYLKGVGAIPVERKKISIQTLRNLIKVLRRGSLLIFPEGSRGAGLEKARAGVGFIYKKSQVPVIAAKISGTDKIFVPGRSFPKRVKIKVIFRRVEGLDSFQSSQDLTAKITETIEGIDKYS